MFRGKSRLEWPFLPGSQFRRDHLCGFQDRGRFYPRHGEVISQCFRRRNLGLGGLYVLGLEAGQPQVPLADPGFQESGQDVALLYLGRGDGLHLLERLFLGAGLRWQHLPSGPAGDAALEGHDLPVEGVNLKIVLNGIFAGGLGGPGFGQDLLFLLLPFLDLVLGGDGLAGIISVRWAAGEPRIYQLLQVGGATILGHAAGFDGLRDRLLGPFIRDGGLGSV